MSAQGTHGEASKMPENSRKIAEGHGKNGEGRVEQKVGGVTN